MNIKRYTLSLTALLASTLVQAASLEALWQDSQSPTYQPPSSSDLAQIERLFQRSFAQPTDATLAIDWATLGFQWERIQAQGRTFMVIREQPDRLQGRGFYAVAVTPDPAPILQAPHALSDRHTGVITLRLFESGQFTAGAWSTAPRSYETDDDGPVNADMAHLPDSGFIAFSRAVARVYPNRAILQWHGFANEKRKTDAGRQAGAIVSAGQKPSTPAAQQTMHCLGAVLPEPVLLYPDQVKELGGVTNQIGQTLRAMGNMGFVHIELAAPLREQLRTDTELRQQLGNCLEGIRP